MLARYLPQEGSTVHMYTLAKGLIARGHEVAIASAGHNGSDGAVAIYKQSLIDGVQHLHMPFPLNPSFSLLGKSLQAAMYIAGIPVALRRIGHWNPDVIHVHYPVTSFLADLYRRRTGTRFVTTHHTTNIPEHPLHRKADLVAAISSELRHELIDDFGYPSDRVLLVPNGIEIDRFRYLKDSDRDVTLQSLNLQVARHKTIIGFIGSISVGKGLDILLRAVANLDPSQFQVVIVGDGDLDWLNALIVELELKDSVSVFGFSNPEPFYSIFDVFILPSRQEGFGLVAVEAMASKVLTVRSKVGGALDQIEHGATGYLFESENVHQLRTILQSTFENKSRNDAIALAGQRNVTEHFSAETMIIHLECIYARLIKCRSECVRDCAGRGVCEV